MFCKKNAKRAAALKAVKLLHKMGELDNYLLPVKRRTELSEDVNFLFEHWPKDGDKHVGGKRKRPYNIMVNIKYKIIFELTPILCFENAMLS